MVSDKPIHNAFRIHKLNSLEKIFIFTIYQNRTLALSQLSQQFFFFQLRCSIIAMNSLIHQQWRIQKGAQQAHAPSNF